jgi:hypothetical protein
VLTHPRSLTLSNHCRTDSREPSSVAARGGIPARSGKASLRFGEPDRKTTWTCDISPPPELVMRPLGCGRRPQGTLAGPLCWPAPLHGPGCGADTIPGPKQRLRSGNFTCTRNSGTARTAPALARGLPGSPPHPRFRAPAGHRKVSDAHPLPGHVDLVTDRSVLENQDRAQAGLRRTAMVRS